MIVSLLLIVGCLLSLLVLGALLVGVIVILNSGNNDVVSMARQGWINRRSEKDEDGW